MMSLSHTMWPCCNWAMTYNTHSLHVFGSSICNSLQYQVGAAPFLCILSWFAHFGWWSLSFSSPSYSLCSLMPQARYLAICIILLMHSLLVPAIGLVASSTAIDITFFGCPCDPWGTPSRPGYIPLHSDHFVCRVEHLGQGLVQVKTFAAFHHILSWFIPSLIFHSDVSYPHQYLACVSSFDLFCFFQSHPYLLIEHLHWV